MRIATRFSAQSTADEVSEGVDGPARAHRHRRRVRIGIETAKTLAPAAQRSPSPCAVEEIADLCGHLGTAVTEAVYRHELRPVLPGGVAAFDRIFPSSEDIGGG